MEDNYTSYIPEQLARKLLEQGMYLHSYYDYSDGKPYFETIRAGEPGWQKSQRCRIPTYGEVFDWFLSQKSIIITLEPFFVFALRNHIGYTWKVSYPNINTAKMEEVTEEDEWDSSKGYGGSFKLTANAAIEYAMRIQPNN